MRDSVVIPVYHLNVLLAISNVWVGYSVYRVIVSTTLILSWKYALTSILVSQAMASATQHITERQCSPHLMRGITCTKHTEHVMLWVDRAMAGVVSVAWVSLIWSHVGFGVFLGSWYSLYLAWCLGLIYVSDNHIRGSPVLYTVIHLVWHLSIYSFLGDIVWWIDEITSIV